MVFNGKMNERLVKAILTSTGHTAIVGNLYEELPADVRSAFENAQLKSLMSSWEKIEHEIPEIDEAFEDHTAEQLQKRMLGRGNDEDGSPTLN